ncbi:Cytochrome P450 82A3 [Euphorbia peplus]|nr:Cytochrome P450 82A3 [Euphorbia peplus]
MDLYSNIIAILVVVSLTVVLKAWKRAKNHGNKGKLVPEVAGGLPVLGHMLHLREKKSLGRIFGAFADKYGPIFSIRLGVHPAVFVSDYNSIKECFTINDITISSRPPSTQAQLVGYNGSSFAFAPYGPYWRNMRKLSSIKLLCNSRIKMLNYIHVSELNYLMKDLYNLRNEKIDLGERFSRMVLNTVTRMVAGRRVYTEKKETRPLGKIIRELIDIVGQVVPGDVIPFIGWLDINGVAKRMKSVSDEVGVIVDGWIEEHKQNPNKAEDKKDFIDVMLSEVTDDEDMGFDQATIIKGTTMTMIMGGSDSTMVTVIWALANLLNNKKILERCQEELELKVGRDRWVQVADVEKLEYLSAVLKESFRMYPLGPIAIPKEVGEDCYISGYFVPKGTRLFINVWKLHRDPTHWSNPDEFIPERFLNEKSNLDVTGNNYEFLPFGAGRRACPGSNLAMQVLNLSIARLIQGFNMSTPNNEPVDMTEGQNLVMGKESPLEVILTPRLDPKLYDQECS